MKSLIESRFEWLSLPGGSASDAGISGRRLLAGNRREGAGEIDGTNLTGMAIACRSLPSNGSLPRLGEIAFQALSPPTAVLYEPLATQSGRSRHCSQFQSERTSIRLELFAFAGLDPAGKPLPPFDRGFVD